MRIYEWDGTNSWTQIGQDIDGEAAYDYSGASVSLSSDGNTVAIGAYGNDGNGNDAGHVRIFSYNGSVWNQMGQDIDGEAAWDESGSSVALNSAGNIVARQIKRPLHTHRFEAGKISNPTVLRP